MISPLSPFSLKGVIWYQGESNHGEGILYRDKTEALLNGWRERWGEAFPYYFVQLASYNYNTATNVLPEFWEAQSAIVATIPNTGMAVITDASDLDRIHPADKLTPGTRLALLALDNTYGQDIVSTGPVFQTLEITNGTLEVYFDSAVGLTTRDALAPDWFEIAGSDDVFSSAVALIVGEHVVLSSPSVSAPVSVRFNDPYFSVNNGLDEARHVFLGGNGLPEFQNPQRMGVMRSPCGQRLLPSPHDVRRRVQVRITPPEADHIR